MVVGNATELDIDQVFRALADATRRDILTRAVARGQSVSTLARRYDMSFAAVQKHVAVLERAQLVTKQKQGREQIVYGETAVLRHVTELLETYEQLWIQRTHQIADLLAGEEGSPE